MKKLKGIILGLLIFGVIVGGIIFWQANQKIDDPNTVTVEAEYPMNDLLSAPDEVLTAMTGKNIAVTGFIMANEGDEFERTITLGMDQLNSIICQIDNRYLETLSKHQKGQMVKIQGTLSGHDSDDMLGKTIQLKNCVLGNFKK
jgi:hypothetical protein